MPTKNGTAPRDAAMVTEATLGVSVSELSEF